jgi:hypothetical protein
MGSQEKSNNDFDDVNMRNARRAGLFERVCLTSDRQRIGCGEQTGRVVDWLNVIRGEFDETPDLGITCEEAGQLWGLEVTIVQAILDALVDAGFLRRSSDGVYSRPPRPNGLGASGRPVSSARQRPIGLGSEPARARRI